MTDPTNEVTVAILGDKEWHVRHFFKDHESTLYFQVVEITMWDGDVYWFDNADWGKPDTTNPEEAEVFMDGAIKWDGCSNWSFCGKTSVHICGPEGVDRLKQLFDGMYAIAQERMPGYRFMPGAAA
ncbi:hypothetical protein I6F34_01335 [Bradyrhizobium sp. BRP05]|nr:hypothetical protein [Bradyrhizobium sp. BRP05]